jgi:formin-binding protein 4
VPEAGDTKNCTSIAEEKTIAPEPTVEIKSTKAAEDIPDTSGMQIVGDSGGNWKAVMHEQSNQCYYWNTVTGETSWEMPNGLTSGVASVPTTHMDYSVEAQTHILPRNSLEVYLNGVSVGNGTPAYATFGLECGSAHFTQDAYAYTASAMSYEDIDPLQLAKYGGGLLQRLNQLERCLLPS